VIYTSQWERFAPGFKKEPKISIEELFVFKQTNKKYSTAQKLHVVTKKSENIVLFYMELNNILENSKQRISNKSTGAEVMRTELLSNTKLKC